MARDDNLPGFDPRPTARIDHGMPEKASVVGLSDSAFRLFIEAICYCSRQETDGAIPKPVIERMATRKTAPKELVRHGHLVDDGDHWQLVDYLRFNRARVEIDSFRASKGEAGTKGAHMRWHVPRRQFVESCEHCIADRGNNVHHLA